MHIDPEGFLETLRPALAAGDAAGLAKLVRDRWRPEEVCGLLRHPDTDARRVAAVALGMVGDKSIIPCLARALRDPDAQVNEMAEHSLWSIWFRSCSPQAIRPFKEGAALLAAESYGPAIKCFQKAVELDPEFAEAYNQCALAHYFLGEYSRSLKDCCQVIKLMPLHFGAIAGMGHCYTQLGDMEMALRCYRRALHINPRMSGIRAAIERLEERMRNINDASGEFLVENLPR